MDRIYVTVRARPLSADDATSSPWRISGNSIAFHNQSYKFDFDRIFGEDCITREVYEARTREIVDAAVRGFNGTVFAYGQTSSGKTHTMRGCAGEPGVIPLAVRDLFSILQEDTDREFLLRMSYMEIYNEEINDLLAPEHRRLQIHESPERGIYVAGLGEKIVTSPEEVLDMMEFGETHRHIGETNMNLHSSRSHTIFRMIIESRDKPEEGELENSCDAVRVSVLNLVDLAGSERAAKTGAEGVRLKEGSHINKSLLALGTVIKKLSEGAESQGGHVPYRDSKLTRILQPALGGNANTAIICNITLAQVHADETKSTLQFASRALRVTNCAHVNEVLTDAALLKRQKKEIEELQAKLQVSHSEHFDEEILNLRNTLLKTELERERIALELEEERRSHAERVKRFEEQDKKIKNLSSMVLISNRDENRLHRKRDKRRDTWCPGKLDHEVSTDISFAANKKNLLIENERPERQILPLLPFDELINETKDSTNLPNKQLDDYNNMISETMFPDPCELLNVTSRRKAPLKKKHASADKDELQEFQTAYEELLLKFETQSIMYEVQLDCLRRKLNEVSVKDNNSVKDINCRCNFQNNPIHGLDNIISLRESEAILTIKHLEDQVMELEQERSLSQHNLNDVYELAKQQNMHAKEEYEELCKEISNAKEEARLARDQHSSEECHSKSEMIDTDSFANLLVEVQHTLDEFQSFGTSVDTSTLMTNELWQSFSAMLSLFPDFRSSICELSVQLQGIAKDYDTLKNSYKNRLTAIEIEKVMKLEQERSLSEQNLNDIYELAKQQNMHAMKEHEELCKELSSAKEEARLARDQLSSEEYHSKSKMIDTDSFAEIIVEVQHTLDEFQCFGPSVDTSSLVTNELMQSYSSMLSLFPDFKSSIRELSVQLQGIAKDYDTLKNSYNSRLTTIENEKLVLLKESAELRDRVDGLNADIQKSDKALADLSEQHDLEKSELVSYIQRVEREMASLSTSSLSKEKESLRKDLEKTRSKLKDTDSKLKNVIQEKTRLEGENANAEKEIKKLIGQKGLLERDISRQQSRDPIRPESLAGRRRDSFVGRGSNAFELKRLKGNENNPQHMHMLQEDYKKLEVLAFEMEATIASLEEELVTAKQEKREIAVVNETLSSELEVLSEKLNTSNSDSTMLHEEILGLILKLQKSEAAHSSLENKVSLLLEEKEELAMQLTNALLELEEERAIWSSKEKASVEGIKEKANAYNAEILSLTTEISKVNNEYRKERVRLRMMLRNTQASLDAFRDRYREALDQNDLMDQKFKAAASNLKERLVAKAIENLDLKKQMASMQVH